MNMRIALFLHKWFGYKPLTRLQYNGETIYVPKWKVNKFKKIIEAEKAKKQASEKK